MKKNKIMSGVLAVAALGAVNATAQINYQSGDLLAGFRNGTANDVIVDLGSISALQGATTPVNFTGTSSALASVFGGVSGVKWSVFGVNSASPDTLWTSKARSNPLLANSPAPAVASADAQDAVSLDIQQVGGSTVHGPGVPVTDVSANIVKVSNTTGFGYSPVIKDGDDNGNFHGDWYNIEQTGSGVADLFRSAPSDTFARGTYLGSFALDPTGNFTFTPVPEPSTWAVLGTGLLTLVAFRRLGRSKPGKSVS